MPTRLGRGHMGRNDAGKIHTAPDNHYSTSPVAEIMKLPVEALAADDCALLLWCTWPHITIGTHVEIIKRGASSRTLRVRLGQATPTADAGGGNGYYTRPTPKSALSPPRARRCGSPPTCTKW